MPFGPKKLGATEPRTNPPAARPEVGLAMRILLAFLLLVLCASDAQAWGAAGHAVVAELVQRRLRPDVLIALRQMLGGSVSLASVSNWADTMALLRPETRSWHFVNIQVGSLSYDRDRDGPGGRCIVEVIARQRAALADLGRSAAERAEALKFLIHLVTDIHQPLHCATRGGDLGASLLPVTFAGKPMNLHFVWDVAVIEAATFDWGEIVARLERSMPIDEPAHGTPEDWAWQSHRLAAEVAYDLPADGVLDEAYRVRAAAAVDRQLLRAAARLTRLLEDVFSPVPATPPAP